MGEEKAKTSIFGEIAPKFGWKMGILGWKMGIFGEEKGKMGILGGIAPKCGWKMGILGEMDPKMGGK